MKGFAMNFTKWSQSRYLFHALDHFLRHLHRRSVENPEGTWSKPTIPKRGNVNKKILPWAIGKYSFATNDAKQWAAWASII